LLPNQPSFSTLSSILFFSTPRGRGLALALSALHPHTGVLGIVIHFGNTHSIGMARIAFTGAQGIKNGVNDINRLYKGHGIFTTEHEDRRISSGSLGNGS
jgi:hypothetical protein